MFEFKHSIGVKHYSVVNGKGGYYGSTETYKVFVQPLDLEDVLQADGAFNKKIKIYANLDSGINVEDKIIFEGVAYKVTDVIHYRATTNVSHDKIIAVEV